MESSTTIPESRGLSGSRCFCLNTPLPSGQTGEFYGTPWRKTKRQGQAQDIDSTELQKSRLSLRPEKENAATQKLQKAYAGRYDPTIMSEAKQNISELLDEETEKHAVLDSVHRSNTVQKEKKVMQEAER